MTITLTLTLNGQTCRTTAATLAALLEEQGLTGRLATARNGNFVPAAQRTATAIAEGDRIEVVAPMQGG